MHLLHLVRKQPHIVALIVVGAAILPGVTARAAPAPVPAPVVRFDDRAVHARAHADDIASLRIRALEHRVRDLRHDKRDLAKWGDNWRHVAKKFIRKYNALQRRLGGYAAPWRYAGAVSGRAREVVAFASRYLGVPYVWGGASPSGFDCSGLVRYVYAHVGIWLAHGATYQQRASRQIPLSALHPGDLVFYGGPWRSYHVAIAIGGGRTIEASGSCVRYGWVGNAWTGGTFFH